MGGFYANMLVLFATQMFQLPSVTTMIIAATQTYRSLAEFAGGTTEMYYFFKISLLQRSFLSITVQLTCEPLKR